eukprot:TRINITY_DN11012_c0_g1_i1.p1 TRINITY_DN11012_c0_g1~~TRINITY_DN11012_c0_g1_i1.p1  ORF type:complete len:182 (-),score=26.80 TRINITY_DN11012_c0_g1_i1:261-806(-)
MHRVLCLHGFGESRDSMTSRVAPLATSLGDKYQLVVPPHSEPWWRASSMLCPDYRGCADSLEWLRGFVEANGPFEGVLGFSQGACLAALLCALQDKGEQWGFQFAVICCGFQSRDSRHDELFAGQISIRSLHVIGDRDWCFLRWMAKSLAEKKFRVPTVLHHDGAHEFPANVEEIVRFVRS